MSFQKFRPSHIVGVFIVNNKKIEFITTNWCLTVIFLIGNQMCCQFNIKKNIKKKFINLLFRFNEISIRIEYLSRKKKNNLFILLIKIFEKIKTPKIIQFLHQIKQKTTCMNVGTYNEYKPVNWAHAWHLFGIAYAFGDQSFLNLPCEHSRILTLKIGDSLDYSGRRYFWLGAADHARFYRASLIVSTEYFAHTAVWHSELSRYVARPHALLSQFHNTLSDQIGQRPPIHEYATQLVYPTMTFDINKRHILIKTRKIALNSWHKMTSGSKKEQKQLPSLISTQFTVTILSCSHKMI